MSADLYFDFEVCDRAAEVYLMCLGWFANSIANDGENASLAEAVERRRSCAREIMARAQSPIEEIMGAILPFVCTGYDYPFDHCGPDVQFGCDIQQQFEIGTYRVDFLLTCYWAGFRRYLVIECDGHEFHEKTKDQVARDKARDRKISATGATILRFSGSEIYRRPLQIREEIESVLENVMHDAIVDSGDLRRRVDSMGASSRNGEAE